MGYKVAPLARLIEQFERMPGIGKKSAQRIAFHVLGMSEKEAKNFAQCIIDAKEKIHRCSVCGDLTDGELCPICDNITRDKGLICVVENPADVLAFERTREYKGVYHVLHGVISPINGIGPEELNVKSLISRVAPGGVKEVIIATDPTLAGEATAMYLSKLIKPFGVTVSRLAYGVPVGGDLEYADEITLQRAIEGRQVL